MGLYVFNCPFQFRWLRGYIHSSCYYHHQIGSINFIHYHIFPWLCAWEVCCIIFCHLLHIRSGKPGFCFHYYCADYGECKYSDTFWLADRVRLFVHYTISLSSLCKLIWGHWTYEMPVRYILSSVRVRYIYFLSYPLYNIWGCVFSVNPFPLWWLGEHTRFLIIIIKSEVWTIIHCLGLGHETMVCAVCLSIYLFLWPVHMGK